MTTVERTTGGSGSAVAPADATTGPADGAADGVVASGIRSGVWGELTAEA